MNEIGDNVNFSSQKKAGLDKGVIINIILISIAVLVIGSASFIFYGAFSEGRFKDTSPNDDTYSDFQGEEQYYDGEENWNLDYSNENDNENDNEVRQIEEASYDDLNGGLRTRISEGGSLRFDYDGKDYEMFIDSVNGNSVEITMQNNQVIFSSIDLGDYGMFDLDGDFVYDLKVSLLEIVSIDGIFDVFAVSEEYEPSVENKPENVSEFAVFGTETSPYSCTEKDGYVEYSFLKISTADGNVYDEKKIDIIREDVCVGSKDYYRKYYCEGKEFNSTYVHCDSRFESCLDAQCVKTKYERLLSDSDNSEQDYSGTSECLVKLGDDTFWFSSGITECENIYMASKVFSRNVFFDYMSFEGLYYPVFRAHFTTPSELEFYYFNESGDSINLSYINNLIESDVCKSFSFLGLDTYCFNSIQGEKSNNLEYFFYAIEFLADFNYDYGSSFMTGATFDFLKSKVSNYVDSSDSSLIDGSSCNQGVYSSYNDGNFYICEDAMAGQGEDGNMANVTIDVFMDLLGSLNGYSQEECFEVVIDTSYEIKYYGSYDGETEDEDKPGHCTCGDCYNAVLDSCTAHDKTIVQNETYEYLDMNSLLGEKINFLYKMYKNYEVPYSEREVFYSRADELVSTVTCEDGIYSQYVNFDGEEIIIPETMPDRFNIPY